MTNPTSNFGWQMPTSTDLVTDLPADFAVFGQAVDTSMADLKGGTTGQILSKATNTDMDFTWVTNDVGDITAVTAGTGISGGGTTGAVTITNDMATTITAAGDIVIGTGSGTYDNLPIGTTDQVLTADTTVSPYKVKWATPAASSGPTFSVYLNTAQTITTATLTKVQLATEVWDSDNCYDNTTNYRFTPTKAGYYHMIGYMYSSGTSATRSIFNFHRNGNLYARFFDNGAGNWIGNGSTLMYFNGTTDYAELYTYLTGTNLKIEAGQEFTSFSGVWIRS